MEYRICDAQKHHVGDIHTIEEECFSVPWTDEQIASQLGDDRHIFLVAVDNDYRVLGYIGLMFVLDEGYISNVAVTAAARKKGIARALINTLLTRARELTLSFITLEVRESNEAARRLYESCGFTDVGIRKNYYEFPKENAILMTLYLK